MPSRATLRPLYPLAVIASGALLIALAIGLAMAQRPTGEVVIVAEDLARLVLVKDVAEVRQIEIVNRTGRRITLHGAQGWG